MLRMQATAKQANANQAREAKAKAKVAAKEAKAKDIMQAREAKAKAKVAAKEAKAKDIMQAREAKAKAKVDAKLEKAMSKSNEFKDTIDHLHSTISKLENPKVVLLRNREVLQWIYGDTSFLSNKPTEDRWGQTLMKECRPDLKMDKQWTNLFGEMIATEVYLLLGQEVTKPRKLNHYQPDLETEKIIEVKTQTFYTDGTAGEKILGCPFKYAEVPVLYGKPLTILCIGGAEKACREQYGNLEGNQCSPLKQEFLEFYRSKKIEYIGITDLLKL
jgi:hypothetical protein